MSLSLSRLGVALSSAAVVVLGGGVAAVAASAPSSAVDVVSDDPVESPSPSPSVVEDEGDDGDDEDDGPRQWTRTVTPRSVAPRQRPRTVAPTAEGGDDAAPDDDERQGRGRAGRRRASAPRAVQRLGARAGGRRQGGGVDGLPQPPGGRLRRPRHRGGADHGGVRRRRRVGDHRRGRVTKTDQGQATKASPPRPATAKATARRQGQGEVPRLTPDVTPRPSRCQAAPRWRTGSAAPSR